jgi:hypothetical protein
MALSRRRVLGVGVAGVAVSLAGCSTLASSEYESVTIDELDFASEEPEGYDEYDPQPEDTYEEGAEVHFYVGVRGLSVEDGELSVEVTFEVDPPDDFETLDRTDSLEPDVGLLDNADKYMLSTAWDSEDAPEGEYETTVAVTDEHADESDAESATFTVED